MASSAFQLEHLRRVPPHAVVDDGVSLVREKRGRRMAGFANAILRRLASDRPPAPALPSRLVVPAWLQKALAESLGDDRTDALLKLDPGPVSVDLRVRADLDRTRVADALRAEHPDASVALTDLSPYGLRVSSAGNPRSFAAYGEGAFAVQEEGSQQVGLLVSARAEDSVLDACAGQGGKTSQLVEAVGPHGRVVAADLHQHRLDRIPQELERLGFDTTVTRACVDWTVGPGEVRGPFDRVLVDAPCTGLGTLRRRPEILLRVRPDDAARMGEIQRRILERASALVRPGGRLLYAVCSPLAEEGAEVAAAARLPGFEPVKIASFGLRSLPFRSIESALLGPWVEGAGPWADAYQVSMWVYVG